MATVIERDFSHDSGVSSAFTAVVAILAIVLIVGVALYMLQVYPFNAAAPADRGTINVDVNGSLPPANPPAPTGPTY